MMTAMLRTRTRTLSLLAAGLLAAGLFAAACGDAPGAPAAVSSSLTVSSTHGPVGAVVTLDYQSFEPGVVTIHVGQSVKWTWADKLPYDVQFSDGLTSPTQITGTWYRTFNTPGTYTYQCSFRERMTGTVIVEPSSAP
jgi:plastocyanin